MLAGAGLFHRRHDNVVDRSDPGAAWISITYVLGVKTLAQYASLRGSPTPYRKSKRLRAAYLMPAIVARALRLEIVPDQVDPRVLVNTGGPRRLPAS